MSVSYSKALYSMMYISRVESQTQPKALCVQSLWRVLHISDEFAAPYERATLSRRCGRRKNGKEWAKKREKIHLRIVWQSYEVQVHLELPHAETYWQEKSYDELNIEILNNGELK